MQIYAQILCLFQSTEKHTTTKHKNSKSTMAEGQQCKCHQFFGVGYKQSKKKIKNHNPNLSKYALLKKQQKSAKPTTNMPNQEPPK